MSFVLKYIDQGEHQQQDFKTRIQDSRKIAKTLVSFANTDGGRLLIGVKDNGTVSGVNVEEEFHMIEAASEMYCNPVVPFKYQVWKVDYKSVLEILVEPSEKRPHQAETEEGKWSAYLRRQDQDIRANNVMMKVWLHERSLLNENFSYSPENIKLFNYLKRRDKITFITVARITKLDFEETENLLAKLIAWEILEIHFTAKGCFYNLSAKGENELEL